MPESLECQLAAKLLQHNLAIDPISGNIPVELGKSIQSMPVQGFAFFEGLNNGEVPRQIGIVLYYLQLRGVSHDYWANNWSRQGIGYQDLKATFDLMEKLLIETQGILNPYGGINDRYIPIKEASDHNLAAYNSS